MSQNQQQQKIPQLYVIPEPLRIQLRRYLGRQPYDEVRDLCWALENLNTVTLANPRPAEELVDKVREEIDKLGDAEPTQGQVLEIIDEIKTDKEKEG
jgi:hypothetical protein